MENLPKHVAIIMDGNRRWAQKKGLPPLSGHQQAAQKVIESLVEKARDLGIKFLTFWAFSTENWQRDKKEIKGLMGIFRQAFKEKTEKLNKKGIRLNVLGDLSKFPADIREKIKEGVKATQKNEKIFVNFALNYGGRDEIIRTIYRLYLKEKLKIKKEKLREEDVDKYLDTAGMPDPDFLIRTGGEMRLSGFLPWQSAYSELYFTNVLFPDFTPQEFEKAIEEFQKRERRFGGG